VSAVSAPYHQGQSPWPDNQSQRPDRPPPLQFRPDDQGPRGNQALAWTLRVIGLVGVAVVSGVVWWYITSGDGKGESTGNGSGQTQPQSEGKYPFTAELDSAVVEDDCSKHAYGKTQQFFVENPCERLTRSAYSTEVNGRTVYASVAVVDFGDAAPAGELKSLTSSDGTGNVNDLVREGVVKVDGLEALSGSGGYAAEVQGNRITIVESDYDPSAGGGSEEELDDVSRDALRLGGEITANGN
jgi:hypothetical protein